MKTFKGYTQAQLRELFTYNSSTGQLYANKAAGNNNYKPGRKIGKASKRFGYVRVTIEHTYTRVLAHRLIWFLVHGKLPQFLDHIDGDKANNILSNLRPATYSQNVYNTGARITNKCRYKNIYLCKYTNKYRVRVGVNGRYIEGGRYRDLKDAIEVRDKLLKKYHKEYANFKNR